MPTDTKVDNLVINQLSKAQYEAIQNPSATEIYLVPDVVDNAPTQGSSNPVASGGVYTALQGKANVSDVLTDYDFTELAAPTIESDAATITFAAGKRNTVELDTSADVSIAIVCNNKADNYIWVTNSHLTDDIDVTFSSISFGANTVSDVLGTDSIPTIPAGDTLEIGIYVTDTKARITSRLL